MIKSQKRNLRAVIGIIFMLAASPLTVTYVDADLANENVEESIKFSTDKVKSKQEKKQVLKTILTEKAVDGKLLVRHFEVPEDASPDEIRKILLSYGETRGWAYVKNKSYNAGIVLFDGKVIKVGERDLKLSSQGTIKRGKTLESDLSGRAYDSQIILHGNASNNDFRYRIVLSGKIAQTENEDSLAIAFIHAGLKNPEMGSSIKFFQIGLGHCVSI